MCAKMLFSDARASFYHSRSMHFEALEENNGILGAF